MQKPAAGSFGLQHNPDPNAPRRTDRVTGPTLLCLSEPYSRGAEARATVPALGDLGKPETGHCHQTQHWAAREVLLTGTSPH